MSYCVQCGIPHTGGLCGRRTVAEQLDSAKSGDEFGQVLSGLFSALDEARWEQEDDE